LHSQCGPRHSTHPGEEIAHFQQILEILLLTALNVTDVSAPHDIPLIAMLQPDTRNERFFYILACMFFVYGPDPDLCRTKKRGGLCTMQR
jgi:hypothetical protein